MKNPIKFLKHLVKDPVNTMAEADAKQKEIMPCLYGSIALAVIGCVVDGILSTGILMIFGMIGVFATMFFGFLLFVLKKVKARFRALTCNKCNTLVEIKTPEDYAKFVSYIIDSHFADYKGISHPASQDGVVSKITASAHARAKVSINLTCPKCGTVKFLKYDITPFKCEYVQEKVLVKDVEVVKSRLETAVKEVVEDYNNPDKNAQMPYTIHSKKNPKYEQRTKAQMGNDTISYPVYKGVKFKYRKDVEEMVDSYFLENQIDGNLYDPNEPKKDKKVK